MDIPTTKEPQPPYRPFKSGAHVALGVEKVPESDWIQMDQGYLDRLDERITAMEGNPHWTIGFNGISSPAIIELFTQVIVEHVPKGFPTMFRATATPLKTSNVEEDFYLMCPDCNEEFRLQGFISCFPGGFDDPSRIGMSFRDIHVPVPHYEERIGKGVDRFVTRIKTGDLVQRFNVFVLPFAWSLQVDGKDLFLLDGNNYYSEKGHTLPDGSESIDIDQCWLRYGRQTLKVLPKTKAIIFCIRLYMTSLRDIVKEGNGVKLADAIDSMPEKLGDYKSDRFGERIL